MKQPRIIAIANQKGGVGKTTTTINLATAMAAVGKRVLLVDLDPQGNASTGVGVPMALRSPGSYAVLFGDVPLDQAIRHTAIPGMDIIPAASDLAGAEIELVPENRREFFLASSLRGRNLRDELAADASTAADPATAYDEGEDSPYPPERAAFDASADIDAAIRAGIAEQEALSNPGYDYILIDCPPALGLLTLNALVAADAVLVPLQCEFYAMEGLSHLLRTIDIISRNFNPGLKLQGVVLTMYDRRNALSRQVEEEVRAHLGDKVYQNVIPRNVRISEAPSHGKPVLIYDFRSTGAQAYIQLAREVLQRETTFSQTENLVGAV